MYALQDKFIFDKFMFQVLKC